MIIKNYGLFWRRTDVYFGKQGNKRPSCLMGKMARQRRGDPVDFKYQRGVYVLYDENFKIVYVGQAGAGTARLLSRLSQHQYDHLAQRWSRFSWFGILSVDKGELIDDDEPQQPTIPDILNHIEAILLAVTEPPLNLQRGRFGQDAQQYIQVPVSLDYDNEEEVVVDYDDDDE